MSFEEYIKRETDSIVEQMRVKSLLGKIEFTERDEAWLRAGITRGMGLVGIGLARIIDDIADDIKPNPKGNTNSRNINIYRCPNCQGGTLIIDDDTVLTMYPVKYQYQCNKCGYVDYKDF